MATVQGWRSLNRSRPSTPAVRRGPAARLLPVGPLGGCTSLSWGPISEPADGAVLTELLFLAEFCNTPMAGAI
jgi:hypothetical protein